MKCLLLIFVFWIAIVGGDPCALFNGDKGVCKPLKDCDLINKIINKPRSTQNEEFVERSKCTFNETESGICCPKLDTLSCITPEYLEGRCVGLSSCPHLAALAEDRKNATLINNYECTGPEDNSVCCGLPPEETIYILESQHACQSNATSFPPDPDSECCGLDDSFGNRILGGNATAIDEYPWLVAIEYVKVNERLLLCGGSLISSRYVLTAGHCVNGPILFVGKPKFVRLGDYNVANKGPDCVTSDGEPDCTTGAIIAPIEKTVTHPQFRPYHRDRRYDIALIRLKITAPFTGFIRPICLPKRDYMKSPPDKYRLYVAGWGTYKQDVAANLYWTSEVKQHVIVPYVDKQKCQVAIQKLRRTNKTVVFEDHICAGGVSGKDSCNADSGGPLMYETDRLYEIIGIVSFGAGVCGQNDVPAVYTYVYEHIPWIKKVIKP